MHIVEGIVDLVEWLAVSDELVNLETAILPVLHQAWQLTAALDTTERAALPLAAGDELEWSCGNFCKLSA